MSHSTNNLRTRRAWELHSRGSGPGPRSTDPINARISRALSHLEEGNRASVQKGMDKENHTEAYGNTAEPSTASVRHGVSSGRGGQEAAHFPCSGKVIRMCHAARPFERLRDLAIAPANEAAMT